MITERTAERIVRRLLASAFALLLDGGMIAGATWLALVIAAKLSA